MVDALNALRGVKMAADAIDIPNVSTELGAAFGEDISTSDLLFAVKREPIAHRVVFAVAHDIFDNWFKVVDTEGNGDEQLDAKVQDALNKLNAKSVLTEMAVYERLFGWALIIMGFRDGDELSTQLEGKAPLEEIAAYGPTAVAQVQEDAGLDSPRFGLPELISLQRGAAQTLVHQSRFILVATRLLEHRYRGLSVLEPIWDDLTCLRNIRWGMAQTMFRYGSGFPDIEIKGASKTQIDDFTAGGQFKNVHARTYFVHNENQKLEFKGTQGASLNPAPYYEPILENLSAGSGIPKAILRGAHAGALTGSEVNLAEYFKLISDAQSRYEPSVRALIDILIDRGQIKTTAKAYRIQWASGFEHSDTDKALIEVERSQAQINRANYMTVNEVRALDELPPIPAPEGNMVLGVAKIKAATQLPPDMLSNPPPIRGDQGPATHPSMVEGLKAIVNRCVGGEIQRRQALEEAEQIIAEYAEAERGRARAFVRARTGQRLATVTPEMEREYAEMAKRYLGNFESLLDDALRAGVPIE